MGAHMRTVRSRRLALELKHFREEAGLTGEQVAEPMGWSVAKVYRIEGDKVRILVRDVTRLLNLYQVTGAQADAVLELARQARVKDWWQQYSGAIPEWFQFYVGLEAAASEVRVYDSEMAPGLLQTEDYVRAIMSTAPVPDGEDVERQIQVRMERQKRLTAPDAPDHQAGQVLPEGEQSRGHHHRRYSAEHHAPASDPRRDMVVRSQRGDRAGREDCEDDGDREGR